MKVDVSIVEYRRNIAGTSMKFKLNLGQRRTLCTLEVSQDVSCSKHFFSSQQVLIKHFHKELLIPPQKHSGTVIYI